MNQAAPLRFYFDFISPYAYLAWTQMPALAQRCERELEPVPILFAACLNAWGHKGPAEVPPKRRYIIRNVSRLAHRLGVPIAAPPTHPFNPLRALRVASLELPAASRDMLIGRLFEAAWVKCLDISDTGVIAQAVAETGLNLDADALLLESERPVAKTRLRVQTEQAIAAGVFGVPTIAVDGEYFWGVDALDHVEPFLRGEDPVDPELASRWDSIEASARRPG